MAGLVPTTHRDSRTDRASWHRSTARGRGGDAALALADQEREDDGVEVGHELLVHVDADAPFGQQPEAPVVRLCCDRVGLRVQELPKNITTAWLVFVGDYRSSWRHIPTL